MPAQDYTKWHLPKGAKRRLGKGYITDIAYSPDSSRLAVASSIGIWIYDAETGEELALFTGHTDTVERLAYSPDSRFIASSSADKTVRLWDASAGEHKAILNHDAAIRNLVYSPDGSTIATGSSDLKVRLWDVVTGEHKVILTVSDPYGDCSFAYSPDGSTIAATDFYEATYSYEVCLWDVATGEQKSTFTAAGGGEHFVYSPDGSTIATRNRSGVCLWDVATGEQKATLTPAGGVEHFVYSPDGSTIVTTNRFYGWLWLWDANTAKCKTILTENPSRLVHSPDGKTIAIVSVTPRGGHYLGVSRYRISSPDGPTIAWVTSTGKPTYGPDGRTIATVGYIFEGESSKAGVCLWNAETGELKATLTHAGDVMRFVYSPDGKTIATGDKHFSDGIVRLWNAETGEQKTTLIEHARCGPDFSHSPDGKTIATRMIHSPSPGAQTIVRLWDARTGELKATLTHAREVMPFSPDGTIATQELLWSRVMRFVYSPDGKTIATQAFFRANGTKKKEVWLWDARTGEYKTMLMGHTHGLWSLAYSPDGKTIATINGGQVYLWDAVTGEHKNIFMDSHGLESNSKLVYSPDGSTIATGDKHFVKLWDAVTGELKTALTGHANPVTSIVYSPDGHTIVIGSDSGLHLWDAVTGEPKTALTEHANPVTSFAYSPDGHTIVIGSDSGLHLWDAEKEECKARLSEYGRGFSNPAYSPDGSTIASSEGKQFKLTTKVFLWDAHTGEHKTTLTHSEGFRSFGYSPDGRTIATIGDDGTVLLWEVPSALHQYPSINPREIPGKWRAGYALDVHTLSSRPLSDGRYDTERTELGELVYQLKYRDDMTKIQPLAVVDGYRVLEYLKAIIPIPPSDTNRTFQPVTAIAQEIGRLLSVPVHTDYLTKVKRTVPLKNLPDVRSKREQLQGAFVVQSQDLKDRCVLLVDDLYDSGTTLTEATKVLYEQGGVARVLVLALTQTKTRR